MQANEFRCLLGGPLVISLPWSALSAISALGFGCNETENCRSKNALIEDGVTLGRGIFATKTAFSSALLAQKGVNLSLSKATQ